jgi:hypothetical protein
VPHAGRHRAARAGRISAAGPAYRRPGRHGSGSSAVRSGP